MLSIAYHDDFYAPIGLQAARIYLGLKPEDLALDYAGAVHLGNVTIPTDEFGRMLINYRGPDKTFPIYSISDILDRYLPAGAFRNKIILIGATAIGIYDLRVTPFSTHMAGIEKHASVVDNILRGDLFTARSVCCCSVRDRSRRVHPAATAPGRHVPRLERTVLCTTRSPQRIRVQSGTAIRAFFGYVSQTAYLLHGGAPRPGYPEDVLKLRLETDRGRAHPGSEQGEARRRPQGAHRPVFGHPGFHLVFREAPAGGRGVSAE
jgi:hypothetical protein